MPRPCSRYATALVLLLSTLSVAGTAAARDVDPEPPVVVAEPPALHDARDGVADRDAHVRLLTRRLRVYAGVTVAGTVVASAGTLVAFLTFFDDEAAANAGIIVGMAGATAMLVGVIGMLVSSTRRRRARAVSVLPVVGLEHGEWTARALLTVTLSR